jgi:hypothetical protein
MLITLSIKECIHALNLGVQLFEYGREKLLTAVDNQRILYQVYFASINMSCVMRTTILISHFSQISRNYEMKQKYILTDILNKLY